MRYIRKQGEGTYALSNANESPPQTEHDATTRWKSFGSRNRQLLSEQLLREQYFLCCYSEIRLDLPELGYHIEHIENKSQHPQRTFDYQNLAVCALDTGKLPTGEEAFGGHAQKKQGSVDMDRFIHCQRHDCSRFFAYVSDGRIVPRLDLNEQETALALYTIDLLNLNCGFLTVERKKHWEELDDLFFEHNQKSWDLEQLLQLDLVPTHQHKLNAFFSLTRQFFGPAAENVLEQYAPDLR